MTSNLAPYLARIGLERLEQGFSALARKGEEWLDRGAKGMQAEAFAHDSSALSCHAPPCRASMTALIIDIGGSHTKVALADRSAAGAASWKMLFDLDNHHLDLPSAKALPIERFAEALAAQTRSALEQLGGHAAAVRALGIIWSNALVSRRLAGGAVCGVSGAVTGIGLGKSYRKGEFFTTGLLDGFDLGAAFLGAFEAARIKPEVFVIGNDTIFTLKAAAQADGGMVASTGANATDVDEAGIIFNTECGGLFPIDQELLSEGDRVLLSDRGPGQAVKLEDLMAGKWLPRVLEGYALALADAGHEGLKPLAEHIRARAPAERVFRGRDMAEILGCAECPACLKEWGLERCAREVREITAIVAARAGKLAGLMGYIALCNPLRRSSDALLSLDSSQARHLPGYLTAMEHTLNELAGSGRQPRISLQHPEGEVTVPMKGLLEALAGELAAALRV